ncbi:SCP2 sterol-binding domain-containing protein [Thermomonas flagellata]|uniref:SCP2 sterol-binding domain-containing protein n=1 Tax=Thermomonas flagellata TaxID=2888524 RepID=UPI001F0437A5|nr:SCP2 sterol-binding domain-containing protein [Thermomonas flagellata]
MSPRLLAPTVLLFVFAAAPAFAAHPLMSPEWTQQACEAWNQTPTLTDGLGKWISNDKGRGYKAIHLYRTDCGAATATELVIVKRDGKAVCEYGGPVKHPKLDYAVDYTMHATTQRWKEMGAGEYGPMKAMMFGRLQFTGPKMEAMGVMGPFEAFLRLPGKVAWDAACPAG